ncbi:MAG TPA: tyrosine-type recombinase/integrase [Sporichthyaceae bacterium]|nr:tyrosine-type recombinase/integrase [Sporichthyaceae bacterium]
MSWGWIERNPAIYAHPPKLPKRRARPPEPENLARLLHAAWGSDTELAIFLWLAATTGARRGELVALRWPDFDLDRGILRISANYVVRQGRQLLKGTKTDEDRALSFDSVTVPLLGSFRSARKTALEPARLTLAPDAFLFSPDPAGARPWHPDHFTHAYRQLADEFGIAEPLKNLRHFNATQLLAAGVDLPTTASRLGHADGGATTLRVYASWTKPADRHAAETVAGDLDALRKASTDPQAIPARLKPMARTSWPIDELLPAVVPGAPADYRVVAAGLTSAIAAGRLRPDDRVPNLNDLAAHYGMSRSTTQRAVAMLAAEGVIVRVGVGFVIPASPVPLVASETVSDETPAEAAAAV